MKKGDAKKGLALLDRMSSGRDFDDIDNTPIEMPFGARRPETLADTVARMVKAGIEAEKDEEFESIEEADDFEEDDPDTLDMSPYEFEQLDDGLGTAVVESAPVEDAEVPPPPPTGDDPDPNDQEPG